MESGTDSNVKPVINSTQRNGGQKVVTSVHDDEMRIEKNAGLVMATNNSSIVSKRSVEKLYLEQPHFFRYFVKKPIRRAPTINRGYWLRMRAVDWVIQQFLEKPSDRGKVVVNLGCGYDPVPFQWLAKDPELCANTKFVDVDHQLLMETKRKIITETPQMFDLLHPYRPDARGTDKSILIDSEEYAAVGCDLRNLRRLERLLKTVIDVDSCLVLFVAEVSITYMKTDDADALIAWTSTIAPDVTFCLLEQCSPDQADNPFTMTMMKHFAKLGTPLHSVMKYPGDFEQIHRFRNAGFQHVDWTNLWELWADPRFLTPSQRVALDHVEPFDEWEEFALFASHYCLVVARNQMESLLSERPRSRRDSTASLDSDISARTSSPHKPHNEWFAFKYSKEPGDLCQRHHASAYTIPDQEAIGVHGGVGTRSRLSSTAVTRPRALVAETPVVPPPEMGARCCHTITPLDNGQNLLVGGRGSPLQVFKDCWLQVGKTWQRVHDLPQPRFRHRVVCISLPDNTPGAICFGGKTDSCTVATDVLLWEPDKGWRTLRTTGPEPVPRFAPLFMRLGYNHGLLFGGMRQDGIVCQGLWRWQLHIRNDTILDIAFRQTNKLDASAGTWPWFARFGASYSMQRDEVLILGGIGKSGCIPKPYEILSMIGCFSNYFTTEQELPLRLSCVTPWKTPDCPRPFLIGHSTHKTRSGLSITMGGGATCFSFGNYFNTGIWILYAAEAGMKTDWVVVDVEPARLISEPSKKDALSANEQYGATRDQSIRRMHIKSTEDFDSTVRWNLPYILEGLDIGTCTHKWSVQYLKEKISASREVVVHDAKSRSMNFQRKDFTYRNLPFHHFLNVLSDRHSHIYLRSLATDNPSSTPANLTTDWPEIASDFVLPATLSGMQPSIHSSPLRISNDIAMWLHYDVMANVLFQVKGRRRLALFPPCDLVNLDFPAGSTTSNLDLVIGGEDEKEPQLRIPTGTMPIIANLEAGEALFIPPLWAHTGFSLPPKQGRILKAAVPSVKPKSDQLPDNAVNGDTNDTSDHSQTASASPRSDTSMSDAENPFLSISVNVFFKNMPNAAYAAGRDVYGNRDLACYEDGRKMVEKIIHKFRDDKSRRDVDSGSSVTLDWIPKDLRKAYLERLAAELKDAAKTL